MVDETNATAPVKAAAPAEPQAPWPTRRQRHPCARRGGGPPDENSCRDT